MAVPLWPKGTPLNVHIYVATTANPGEVLSLSPAPGTNLAHLKWDNIKLGDWDIDRTWAAGMRLPAVRDIVFCRRTMCTEWTRDP